MEKDNIFNIPSMSMFNNNWELLLKFIENEGNPPFHIEGNLVLRNQPIKSLGSLVSVGGYVDLSGTLIETLGELKTIGYDLNLYNTHYLISLGKLQTVGQELYAYNSNLSDLGELKSVGGNLNLESCKIKTLGNLEVVRGDINLDNTLIESLGELLFVGGDLTLFKTPNLYMSYTEIKNQVNVEGDVYGIYGKYGK